MGILKSITKIGKSSKASKALKVGGAAVSAAFAVGAVTELLTQVLEARDDSLDYKARRRHEEACRQAMKARKAAAEEREFVQKVAGEMLAKLEAKAEADIKAEAAQARVKDAEDRLAAVQAVVAEAKAEAAQAQAPAPAPAPVLPNVPANKVGKPGNKPGPQAQAQA